MLLDSLDLAILERLQRDARASNKHLADLVGLSPSACLARVRKLEREGVIQRYFAEVDHQAMGAAFDAWATIRMRECSHASMTALAALLSKEDCVVEAFHVAGSFDVIARVVARDKHVWNTLVLQLENNGLIVSARSAIVLRKLKTRAPVRIAPPASDAPE